MLKSTIFREYDIRGVADAELLSDDVTALGQALGTYLRRHGGPNLCLGRDTRLSSTRLRDALTRGLKDSGCHVTDVGVQPTPLLYYATVHHKADGGVMITGSHNPPEFNGFKTVLGSGTIHGEAIQEIRRMIETGDLDRGEGSETAADVTTPYVEEVSAQFHFPRRIRVVVDAGNGVGGPVAHRVLERLNVDAVEMFFEMDGHFPNHHPDPTVPRNLDALIARVKETGARVGIAYDGDADRLGAVDANGDIVWGDRLMILFSRGVLAASPGAAILGEVKCSQTLYDDIAKHGGRPIMWKTGHSLIKTKMKEEGALLAGEMSGHLFFADRYYGYDDAIYASLRLLEILARDPRSLSEMLADVPRTFSTPELRVDCPDAIKFDVVAAVREHYRKAGLPVVDIDGARVS